MLFSSCWNTLKRHLSVSLFLPLNPSYQIILDCNSWCSGIWVPELCDTTKQCLQVHQESPFEPNIDTQVKSSEQMATFWEAAGKMRGWSKMSLHISSCTREEGGHETTDWANGAIHPLTQVCSPKDSGIKTGTIWSPGTLFIHRNHWFLKNRPRRACSGGLCKD